MNAFDYGPADEILMLMKVCQSLDETDDLAKLGAVIAPFKDGSYTNSDIGTAAEVLAQVLSDIDTKYNSLGTNTLKQDYAGPVAGADANSIMSRNTLATDLKASEANSAVVVDAASGAAQSVGSAIKSIWNFGQLLIGALVVALILYAEKKK